MFKLRGKQSILIAVPASSVKEQSDLNAIILAEIVAV